MARIFSIQFTFNHELHNVVVSVKTTPFYMEYTLIDLDNSLTGFLPGNKLISTSSSIYLFPNATDQHSTELINNILNAVALYQQAVNYS